MTPRLAIAAACLLIAAVGIAVWLFIPRVPDHANAGLEEFGTSSVVPTKDPKTGFVVGGKNSTALLRNLTEINGRFLSRMRCQARHDRMTGLSG